MIMLLDVGRLSLDLDPELHEGRANELSSKDGCVHAFFPALACGWDKLDVSKWTVTYPKTTLLCPTLFYVGIYYHNNRNK